jgi:hypothetical protein
MAFDEKIVALINNKRKAIAEAARKAQIAKSFQTGGDCLTVTGLNLKFEEKLILDGQVNLKLPAELEILSPEKARFKYPSASRPELIFTTRDGLVNITFKHSRIPLDEAEVEQFKDRMIAVIQKIQSRVNWQEDGVKQVNGKKIGFFHFIIPALEANIYNLMFFGELNHRALIGNINCPVAQMEYWKPIATGLVETVKIIACRQNPPSKPPGADFTDYQFKSGFYASYHNKEYRVFKLADHNYRLVSRDPSDLAEGFEKKDGVYKKTVQYSELQSFYELKTRIEYQGYQFELRNILKNEVQLLKKNCGLDLVKQLKLQKTGPGEYEKWIAKNEVEDVIEEKIME